MANIITSCILMLGVFFLVKELKSEIQALENSTVKTITALANEFGCEAHLPNKDSIETIIVTCGDGKLITLNGKTGGIHALKK